MQNSETELIINLVWQYFNKMRGTFSVNDMYPSVIYILYGYHKQYMFEKTIRNSIRFISETDELLNDLYLYVESINHHNIDFQLLEFYNTITNISHEKFEIAYPEILSLLNDRISSIGGKVSGEFYTPNEILSLIAYFVNKEACKTIYDPFCGTASIINHLSKDVCFVGQDLNHWSTLLARVVLDASNTNQFTITCTDSLTNWNHRHFDAVIACPPLGVRLSEKQISDLSHNEFNYRTLEDVLFMRSFKDNNANLFIALESLGLTFNSGHYKSLRRFLVENNLLDTIISLPSNLLYGTSISPILIICKRNRKIKAPITFIHAENYFSGENRFKRKFDMHRFLSQYESEETSDIVKVNIENICNNEYNLNPNLYNAEIKLKEGQMAIPLSELITPAEIFREVDHKEIDLVTSSLLSNDFIKVLTNKNKSAHVDDSRQHMLHRCYHSTIYDNLLLVTDSLMSIRYGLRTNDSYFKCSFPIRAYRINTTLIEPEYLVYKLLNNSVLSKGGIPLSGYMRYSIVIDKEKNKQLAVIDKLKYEYNEKIKSEHEADLQRLGIKRNISDLEHMIAPTQFKINQIVSRLERITPGAGNYMTMIKSLKDNVNYMSRIIHFSNVRLNSESINLKEGNLSDFIQTYSEGWKNYGGNYFRLEVVDSETTILTYFDRTLLTVMLDAILSNAIYHGFHKQKNYTEDNTVEISLAKVEYNDKSYACLTIANNGDPMSEEFTINDYISRGRFSSETGRSGLGGNHVYEIVKGHNGFLFLDSNKQWNMIVEVLLPINEPSENLTKYEHECI